MNRLLIRRILLLLWPLLLIVAHYHNGSFAVFAFPVTSSLTTALFSVHKSSSCSKTSRTKLSFRYHEGFLQQPQREHTQSFKEAHAKFTSSIKPLSPTCLQSKKKTDIEATTTHNGEQLLPTWATFATLSAQPVVWISLYYVMTTGGGLPAGPFGLLGLLEGVSYLAVVGIVFLSLYHKIISRTTTVGTTGKIVGAVEGLSYLTLVLGLLVLASLVTNQGCVPNAKPLLDYSAYLPVCDPVEHQTPGRFGST